MCCDGWEANPEDTVGQCPECGSDVDADGDTTEAGCNYAYKPCETCGSAPCSQGC